MLSRRQLQGFVRLRCDGDINIANACLVTTRASPLEKLSACVNVGFMTILPLLSTNPHLPLIPTYAIPSENRVRRVFKEPTLRFRSSFTTRILRGQVQHHLPG